MKLTKNWIPTVRNDINFDDTLTLVTNLDEFERGSGFGVMLICA